MADETPAREPAPGVAVRAAVCHEEGAGRGEWGPLDLELPGGQFLAVLAPPKSGKSLLVRLIAGLAQLRSGEVAIGGKRVEGVRTDVGIVFERPALLGWRTALENVLLTAEVTGGGGGFEREHARIIMALAGLQGTEDRRPHQLNLSQAQRVSLCRALMRDPPLVLLDDPFRLIDPFSREQLWSDLQRLRLTPARTVVLATSQIAEAAVLADRVAIMTPEGKIAASMTIDLPRPRRLDRAMAPRLTEYSATLRTHLNACGLLQ